jgi:hypothetical protein
VIRPELAWSGSKRAADPRLLVRLPTTVTEVAEGCPVPNTQHFANRRRKPVQILYLRRHDLLGKHPTQPNARRRRHGKVLGSVGSRPNSSKRHKWLFDRHLGLPLLICWVLGRGGRSRQQRPRLVGNGPANTVVPSDVKCVPGAPPEAPTTRASQLNGAKAQRQAAVETAPARPVFLLDGRRRRGTIVAVGVSGHVVIEEPRNRYLATPS